MHDNLDDMEQAEQQFLSALQGAVNECRKIGYSPTRFLGMLNGGGPFEVVRSLLAKRDVSEGFTTLWEKGRLDLSVEAIVLKPEWRDYFTPDELEVARDRLGSVDYRAPWDQYEPAASPDNPKIAALLTDLANSTGDRAAGKRIRSQLRALGYFGGLRQRSNDVERGASRSTAGAINLATSGSSSTVGSTESDRPSVLIVLPPIPDAEALIRRIRSLVGLPERNHEDVVKELLIRLGFDVNSIVFQRGRIDISVFTQDRKTAAVFEAKRTIATESERASARRQGMDYAHQTGAPIIVITDGDRYEIYDKRKGHDYEAMFCGKFQLTAFRESDGQTLDLLRPSYLEHVRR